MSTTPFLVGFATRVVMDLEAGGHIEVAPGGQERVVLFVANHLHGLGEGKQLISSLARALIACPEVEELYLDDEELRDLVSGLGI